MTGAFYMTIENLRSESEWLVLRTKFEYYMTRILFILFIIISFVFVAELTEVRRPIELLDFQKLTLFAFLWCFVVFLNVFYSKFFPSFEDFSEYRFKKRLRSLQKTLQKEKTKIPPRAYEDLMVFLLMGPKRFLELQGIYYETESEKRLLLQKSLETILFERSYGMEWKVRLGVFTAVLRIFTETEMYERSVLENIEALAIIHSDEKSVRRMERILLAWDRKSSFTFPSPAFA